MLELTERQMRVVERLFEAGYRPIAIPRYESSICMRKGDCAAMFAPVENGGLRMVAPVSFLVNGNFGVRLKRKGGDVFVWKKDELAATVERLTELERVREELAGILEVVEA